MGGAAPAEEVECKEIYFSGGNGSPERGSANHKILKLAKLIVLSECWQVLISAREGSRISLLVGFSFFAEYSRVYATAILGEKINPLNSDSHRPFQSFFPQPQYRGININILIWLRIFLSRHRPFFVVCFQYVTKRWAGESKKHLSFSAMRKKMAERFRQIEDRRQEAKVDYGVHDCLMSAFAMMFFQDPSMFTFQRRLEDSIQQNNLSG